MAHFAKLDDNNLVIEVYPVANAALDSNNEEASGVAFLTEWSGGHTNWKQTSYNKTKRYNFAGVGYTFDPSYGTGGAFIAPQPYPSWKLSHIDATWKPPIPEPDNGIKRVWDEAAGEWVAYEL